MKIQLSTLLPFQEICRRICLNIPAHYAWQWDEKRAMAVLVMASDDAELVFYPLFKEFNHHWNFSSAPPDTQGVTRWVNDQFGLMPGQVVFTSYPLSDLVLCVAWWPWGEDQKVSMRIGLIPINNFKLKSSAAQKCLYRWLKFDKTDIPS